MINKYLILQFLAILSFNIAHAQKLYVWCPENHSVKARVGFLENQEVNLVIFDGRIIPPKSKIECESNDVEKSLAKFIQDAYPSCKITTLNESDYYKPSAKGKITIKIGIASYQAGFGTDIGVGIGSVGGNFSYGIFAKSEWNGLVSYYVQIFDDRSELDKKLTKEISELTSKSNIWGYKTARACLYASYDKANVSLLSFIESTFMN
ncbi:hypothetical protein [Mucilaginibacter sp.]